VPVKNKPDAKTKRALLDAFQAEVAGEVMPGPDAARSQDFLYGDDGLPA
jgi:hypothetical protein